MSAAFSAVGLGAPDRRKVLRGIVLVILVGWLPLLVLSGFQATILQGSGLREFLSDFAVHCRSLIAAPLFVFADSFCTPRLVAIAWHFRDADLIPQSQQIRFDAAVASTRRLARSTTACIGIVAISYLSVAAMISTVSPELTPAWHRTAPHVAAGYSLAGWWHLFVSLPLLISLFLAWMWRLSLWTRFLWLLSRLDLQLVPVHPDGSAGLLFVGYSVRTFSVLALAIGTIAAGRVANSVLQNGGPQISDKIIVATMVVLVMMLFTAPLLVFSQELLLAWRRGVFEYGALARRLGNQFERKWFGVRAELDETALQVQDYSATTDLYQIVSNTYRVRIVPVDTTSLILLVGAALLPLVPVVLLAIPADVILAAAKDLLF